MPEISLAVEAAVQRQDDLGLNPAGAFRSVAASGSVRLVPKVILPSWPLNTTINTNVLQTYLAIQYQGYNLFSD
jgi:hypothetical protein